VNRDLHTLASAATAGVAIFVPSQEHKYIQALGRLNAIGSNRGLRIGADFHQLVVSDEGSIYQAEGAVTLGGEGGVVGDQNGGEAVVLLEVLNEAEDVSSGAGVEIAGGFVGQEERGFGDEGAGEDDALLLAAGEFAGTVAGAGFEPHILEAGESFRRGGITGFAADEQGHHDVFEGSEFGEQVMDLPDEADVAIAERGGSGFAERGDVLVAVADGAGGGAVESAEEMEQAGFAGAGFADDGDALAGLDGEVEI
jgi:hypothetical protein